MKELTEWRLGTRRVSLLIARDDVAENLAHRPGCPAREETLFELALCGWTEEAFIDEAYGWDPSDG